MSRKPYLVVAVLAAGAALFAVAPALADQVFHTSHAPVHSIAGAPLGSGFVNDMHSNGAVNSAREEYHLSGAQRDTSYQVQPSGRAVTAAAVAAMLSGASRRR